MKQLDSDALGTVNRALGISGRGAQITELLDGQVDQTIGVNDHVRRGRTQTDTKGLWWGTIEHVHGAANSLETAVTLGTITLTVPPWPTPVPEADFDIWLIGAGLTRPSGTGTIDAALYLEPYTSQAWGTDDSDVEVNNIAIIPLAHWDTLNTEFYTFGLNAASGRVFFPINLRCKGDWAIRFASTSSDVITFRMAVLLGLFPVGLGQDAAF